MRVIERLSLQHGGLFGTWSLPGIFLLSVGVLIPVYQGFSYTKATSAI